MGSEMCIRDRYESASLNLFVENGPGETDIVLSAADSWAIRL